MHFDLSAELSRPPVSINALIKNSRAYGRIMLALREVVTGDWRAKIQDYSKYQEWVYQRYLEELPLIYGKVLEQHSKLLEEKAALKNEIALVQDVIKPIRQTLWQARRKYYNWLYKHNRDMWILLDPVISVHPDAVIFEAFSLDESCYGRVTVPSNLLEVFGQTDYGTTNIDFSQALADELYRVRSYRPAWLKVAFEQVELSTSAGSSVEKKIDLPESWVRGFLQVQSASSLPGTRLTLSSTTLNEVLSVLAKNKTKVSPRSIRFRLKKGECPTIVLDPWNIEIKEPKHIYQGEKEGEIRIWGRRRLHVLSSLLAYSETVEVLLLGTGMPSYWSTSIDGHRFDIGLSGWTSNDWAQKGNFDLLASTSNDGLKYVEEIEKHLVKHLAGTPEQFAEWAQIPRPSATAALQELCKQGRAMYDHIKGEYRWRQLLQEDIKLEESEDDKRLTYAIGLVKDNKIKQLSMKKEDGLRKMKFEVYGKNTFKPHIHLDSDGRVKYAECTCSFFRRNKLRMGPCQHIIAATIWSGKQNWD